MEVSGRQNRKGLGMDQKVVVNIRRRWMTWAWDLIESMGVTVTRRNKESRRRLESS